MKYTTKPQRKTRVFPAIIAAALVIGALVAANVIQDRQIEETWDVSYPIVNAHVSWDQTFYGRKD